MERNSKEDRKWKSRCFVISVNRRQGAADVPGKRESGGRQQGQQAFRMTRKTVPRPALRGGVSCVGGRSATPALYPALFSTPRFTCAKGESENPSMQDDNRLFRERPAQSLHKSSEEGRSVRMPPSPGKGHTGRHSGQQRGISPHRGKPCESTAFLSCRDLGEVLYQLLFFCICFLNPIQQVLSFNQEHGHIEQGSAFRCGFQ